MIGSGSVDDYTAWVVGKSAGENMSRIYRDILPGPEQWVREGGAVFESSKTALIHSTGERVGLAQGLRFEDHLASQLGKAYKVASASTRLQGYKVTRPRPSSMHQLLSRIVGPAMEYASPM